MSDATRRGVLVGLAAMAAGCRSGVAAAPSPPTVAIAEPRPLAPGFHAGMNVAHVHREGRGYGSERSRLQLQRLASLGMTHVALTPFGYLPSLDSQNVVYDIGMDPSMTDDHLLAEMAQAQALGLQVVLKPHLWCGAFSRGRSRQDVKPADWAPWFASYTGFLRHYARLAAEGGATWLVVGLEYLQATQYSPGAWAQVARSCRQDFAGKLTYAANWYAEVEAFTDWAAFDAIGVNAYYPLSNAPDPSIAALVAGWQLHLDVLEGLSRTHDRPVLFCEAGLQAVRGSAARPWDHGLAGAPDPLLQARAYEALMRAAADRSWLQGVWWWKWFTDDPGERDPYCPRSLPAEEVLAAWHS